MTVTLSPSSLHQWLAERSAGPLSYPENFLLFERIVFVSVCAAQVFTPRLPWTLPTVTFTGLLFAGLALLLLVEPPMQGTRGTKLAYLIGCITVTFLAVFVFRAIVVLPLYLMIALKGRFLLDRKSFLGIGALIIAAYLGNVAIGESLGWLDKVPTFNPTVVAVNGAILLIVGIWGAAAIVDALAAERTSRTQAETLANELALANRRLVEGARQAEALTTAQERNRIAREIHDSLGHVLTALNIQIEASLKLAQRDPKRAAAALTEAKRLGSEALQEVRRSVRALRPQMLEGQSFAKALQHLTGEFERNTGIPVRFDFHNDLQLEPPYTDALFRVVQEGLTNIARYSQARHVLLHLGPRPHGGWELRLADDGRGFNPDEKRDGFGLWSIRERVQAISAKVEIHSAPGQGCNIRVWLPDQESNDG